MLHKLSTHELAAGMYIADTGVSWLKHPFLYSREGKIRSAYEIQDILKGGYLEVYIDLLRSNKESLPPALAALASDPQSLMPGSLVSQPPTTPLKEEMRAAKTIYKDSMSCAYEIMDNMRQGKFDMPAAEPVVDEIMQSVDRNMDALIGLCKLRQTDSYTYTHCVNVSVLSVMFAKGMGANESQLHAIGMGGLFHDLGKSLIPLHILNAPRRLSEAEFNVIRRHPSLGYQQLKSATNVPPEMLQVVIEHHEKYDGTGYPNKLADSAISFAGRVAAVVDVYDALSSRRIYKEALPLSKSLSILYSMREKEFHPGMAERFIRLLGVYPVGSPVALDDGTLGVVSASNPASPMKPTVMLVKDSKGQKTPSVEVNLDTAGAPSIARNISLAELGDDPGRILGIP